MDPVSRKWNTRGGGGGKEERKKGGREGGREGGRVNQARSFDRSLCQVSFHFSLPLYPPPLPFLSYIV